MTVIKPPSGIMPPIVPPTGPTGQPQTTAKGEGVAPTAAPTVVNPEAVAKALKEYEQIRKKLKQPFISGAAGLFTDSVVFPPELLDPNNPANDPKYLHLLFALFGLKELERFLRSADQRAEEEDDEPTEVISKKSPDKKKKK